MDAFRHSQGKGERGRSSLSLSHQRGTRVAAPHPRPGAKTEVRESLSVPLFLSLASKGGHGPQLLTRKPACLWDQVQRETRVAAPPKACPRRSERGPTPREARARGSQLSLSRIKGGRGSPRKKGGGQIPTSSPGSFDFLWVLLWVSTLSCVFCRREISRYGAYTDRGEEVIPYPGRSKHDSYVCSGFQCIPMGSLVGSHAFVCVLPERDR